MRHTDSRFIALAALTGLAVAATAYTAPATPDAPVEPGYFSLIVVHPDGSEYVIDYNLTGGDCYNYAQPAKRENPQSQIFCELQP